MNMPVIISNRAQQNGTLRGYPILEFKELSSHERHKAWKIWLEADDNHGKRLIKKLHERRHN